MSLGAVGNIFNIIRQLDLNALKKDAERRFTLLVAGEPELARTFAVELSTAPEKEGVHPWIVVQPLPLPLDSGDLTQYNLAMLVLSEVEMNEGQLSALRRLHDAKVPIIVVVVNEAAQTLVGAELARPREAIRVLLPPGFNEVALQNRLAPALLRVAPEELKLALARHLPLLRAPIVQELVEDTARANAIYAASTGLAEVVPVLNLPLNAADILILTKNQLVMAYKIALAAGKRGEPMDVMGEIVGVVGGGFLFRQIARELIGLIPVVGVIPKIAVSYAGTWVIGRTIYLWASEGQRLNVNEVRNFYDEALARGRAMAENLVERMRGEPAALPAPDGKGVNSVPKGRWWHRFFPPKQPALPAPEGKGVDFVQKERWWHRFFPPKQPTLPAPEDGELPEEQPSWWQRLRRRLPF